MSSFQGEMTQTKLNVKAVDQSGTVIMDKPVSTLRSGFMELWLPRNRTINLTISGLNRSATDVCNGQVKTDTIFQATFNSSICSNSIGLL
jgi:hypothetical protein